jgi:hypothetical protein
VLKQLQHAPQSRRGAPMSLSSNWQNIGSAPCYKPYRLAYRLSGPGDYQKVFVSTATVNRWLPGSIELFTSEFFKNPADLPPGPLNAVTDALALPADMPAGKYTLSVAVADESSSPVVRLAIEGRASDGWYPVSQVQIAP